MSERRYPTPNEEKLHALADLDGAVVVSLFVPVTAAVPDATQNPVRHARVVDRALTHWQELGADPDSIAAAKNALADFACESESPSPRVASRAASWSAEHGLHVFGLPFDTGERACVSKGAVLRPIVRAAQAGPQRYRVLVLSANQVALYEGDQNALSPVETKSLPKSLEDALGTELTESSLQYHSTDRHGGRPTFHGQGGASRERDVDLERFLRLVARGLEAEVGGAVIPLVLAADASHRPGLEQFLEQDVGLVPEQLEGNPEHLSLSALHDATWSLVSETAGDAQSSLRIARQGSKPLITQISELVENAVMGRIRRLWVPEHGSIPGRLDRASGRAVEAWGDDDLIESLVVEVLRRGGEVAVVTGHSFPDDADSLAAELR